MEREQVVFSKDETIKNAKDEEINLENFRFMLDQKIKSLTSEKQKLITEIDSREKILRDMFNELIKQSHSNNAIFMQKVRLQRAMLGFKHQSHLQVPVPPLRRPYPTKHEPVVSILNPNQAVSGNVASGLRDQNFDISSKSKRFLFFLIPPPIRAWLH